MKILVTGSTGFIGSNIATEFERLGYKVYRLNFRNFDLAKIGKLDAVFHEAAINDTISANEQEIFQANVNLPKKFFQRVVDQGCRRIVYASSIAVYGNTPPPQKEDAPLNPLNVYAKSKVALDEFAKNFATANPNVVIVGLRYANAYGHGEGHKGRMASMIYQLAQQVTAGNPKIFKDGEQKRDFIYIKDIVRANMLALKAKESGIFNCGFGKAITFNSLIEVLCKILRKYRQIEYIDNPYASAYQNHIECDMNLAKAKLGFIPDYDLERGITDYYESGFLI